MAKADKREIEYRLSELKLRIGYALRDGSNWNEAAYDIIRNLSDLQILIHNENPIAHPNILNALGEKQDNLTEAQLWAVNSGINSALVSKFNNYQVQLNGKASLEGLNSETYRALEAEANLQTELDNETQRAVDIEQRLREDIDGANEGILALNLTTGQINLDLSTLKNGNLFNQSFSSEDNNIYLNNFKQSGDYLNRLQLTFDNNFELAGTSEDITTKFLITLKIGELATQLAAWNTVLLTPSQLDPTTGIPNFDGVPGTIYYAPITSEENPIFKIWLWIENTWYDAGTTDIDLSNVYTKAEIDAMFLPNAHNSDPTAHQDIRNSIINLANLVDFVSGNLSDNYYTKDEVNALIAAITGGGAGLDYELLINKPQLNGHELYQGTSIGINDESAIINLPLDLDPYETKVDSAAALNAHNHDTFSHPEIVGPLAQAISNKYDQTTTYGTWNRTSDPKGDIDVDYKNEDGTINGVKDAIKFLNTGIHIENQNLPAGTFANFWLDREVLSNGELRAINLQVTDVTGGVRIVGGRDASHNLGFFLAGANEPLADSQRLATLGDIPDIPEVNLAFENITGDARDNLNLKGYIDGLNSNIQNVTGTVSILNDKVAEMTPAIQDNTTRIETLESQTANLHNEVVYVRDEVVNLNSDVAILKDKNVWTETGDVPLIDTVTPLLSKEVFDSLGILSDDPRTVVSKVDNTFHIDTSGIQASSDGVNSITCDETGPVAGDINFLNDGSVYIQNLGDVGDGHSSFMFGINYTTFPVNTINGTGINGGNPVNNTSYTIGVAKNARIKLLPGEIIPDREMGGNAIFRLMDMAEFVDEDNGYNLISGIPLAGWRGMRVRIQENSSESNKFFYGYVDDYVATGNKFINVVALSTNYDVSEENVSYLGHTSVVYVPEGADSPLQAYLESSYVHTQLLVTKSYVQWVVAPFQTSISDLWGSIGTITSRLDLMDIKNSAQDGNIANNRINIETLFHYWEQDRATFADIASWQTITGTTVNSLVAITTEHANRITDVEGGVANLYSVKADDNEVVHTDMTESINGVKTFNLCPKIILAPSVALDAANKSYVDSINTITSATVTTAHGDLTVYKSGRTCKLMGQLTMTSAMAANTQANIGAGAVPAGYRPPNVPTNFAPAGATWRAITKRTIISINSTTGNVWFYVTDDLSVGDIVFVDLVWFTAQ